MQTWLHAVLSGSGQADELRFGERPGEGVLKPTATGAWWVKSEETGKVWAPVEIFEENGILMVDDVFVGIFSLDDYHKNKIGIKWKKDVGKG